MKKSLILKSALALAMATPLLASAESQLATGTASAQARLDLRVVIPRFVFLAVGAGAAGTSFTPNGTIDAVQFDFTTNPQAVGGGGAAGSITNGGVVPVRVYGNDGQVTITTSALTAPTDGTNTIPFSEFTVASSNPTGLPVPALTLNATSAPTVAGRVTNQTANWTYTYANNTTPAAGTYTGRVTYTASLP